MNRFIQRSVGRVSSLRSANGSANFLAAQPACRPMSVLRKRENNVNNMAYIMSQSNQYSTSAPLNQSEAEKEGEKKAEGEEETPKEDASEAASEGTNKEEQIAKLEKEVKELKDQVLRSLAEEDNVRRIAKKDVENARLYGVTSFAKSMLDVADNFERALGAIPASKLEELVPEDKSKMQALDSEDAVLLRSLLEGIIATEKGMMKGLSSFGVKRYGEVGEEFNPELHDALFNIEDPDKEAGTIGQVLKTGFMLKERVLRAAQVGTVQN